MLPAEWSPVGKALPQSMGETVLITVHPDHVAHQALQRVDTVIAVGPSPEETFSKFAKATGHTLDWPHGLGFQKRMAVVWSPKQAAPPFPIRILGGRSERIRHHRKYAQGNMHHRSFYFRGPGNRHNLKAHNLAIFSQISDGIDEDTWLFHLRRGDYSRWFRHAVKDSYLADQAELIERRKDLQAADTRRLIRGLIEARYTLPE